METLLYDGDTFTRDGVEFRVEFEPDCDSGPPWEDCDGHGVVSEWTTRAKMPGERVLATDGRSRRYYDVQESTKIAKRDGWDAPPYGGTKGEQAARAVEADFEYLRAWCADEWHYVGVVVTARCPCCGDWSGESESVWGIEDSAVEYLTETVHELASEILYRRAAA